ncbi:hypothetical protein RND81_06G207100 [Saponaria officinalis]|uniref:Ion transport domain-containing protein n=1 Tax=Saponaria officinalis TaxID=3572 RepID=A0AAW1KE49_SAPOF
MAFGAIFGALLGDEIDYQEAFRWLVWRWLVWSVRRVLSGVLQMWNKLFCIACMVSLFVDPLFFFTVSFNQEYRCSVMDVGMARVLVILRSFADFMYLLHILVQFKLAYVDQKPRAGAGDWVSDPKKVAMRYLKGYFIVDFLCVLPLPQVIVMYIIPKFFSEFIFGEDLMDFGILLQYVLRLFRFFPLVAGQSPVGFVFESTWGNSVMTFLAYLLSGHVVGSMWYLFGVQRLKTCLIDACIYSRTPCDALMTCTGFSRLNAESKQFFMSWNNNQDGSACLNPDGKFRYGIYSNAINLIVQPDFAKKYIYSLFWGFQQISTLAGNQIPSDYVPEVLFTTFIIGVGLLLFGSLVGNIHLFFQSAGNRRLEKTQRRCQIERLMDQLGLPEDLRSKIREVEGIRRESDEGVNVEKLMESFPEDLQRQINVFLI